MAPVVRIIGMGMKLYLTMETINMNKKVIYVNGPSFSGKTYLISYLIGNIRESISLIFCEIIYSPIYFKNHKDEFAKQIYSKLKDNNIVMAESVGYYGLIENVSSLNIVCDPSYELHIENYNNYLNSFGKEDAERRSGGISIMMMRKNYNAYYPEDKVVVFNGYNKDYILEKVIEHVRQ